MVIEPIGILTILLALLCIRFGPGLSVYVLPIMTLLGAAAAVILLFLGGASLPPAHLLLGLLSADLVLRRRYLAVALESLRFPRPGFWLMITVLYGVGAAIIMPRLFASATNVFAIGRTGEVGRIVLLPLAPVSGNITQSIYLIGDLLCYTLFFAYAAGHHTAPQRFGRAIVACAIANIFFGVLDYITFYTNTTELLQFIRNANYSMLHEAELGGFKRMVGSFAEASAYGATSLWLFAFVGKLWLSGIHPRLTGSIAALTVIALALSTSTTGYVGFACFVMLEYIASLIRLLRGGTTRQTLIFVTVCPLVAIAAALAATLHQPTWSTIQDIAQITLFEKVDSESGVERSTWNRQALLNVIETAGLGVGVGSTRTSSWLLAVPASLGIIGSLTYFGFVASILLHKSRRRFASREEDEAAAVRGAARSACLAQLLAASIGAPFPDLGLPFFMCAAASVAYGEKPSRAPRLNVAARRPPQHAQHVST
jgi:hypothetical protein